MEESLAHKGSVNGLCFSNTSRHLLTYGCFDGRVRKWDLLEGLNSKTSFASMSKVDVRIHVPIATSEKATGIANEVVFVPNKSNISVMKAEDGQTVNKLCGHFKAVTTLAFSPQTLELFSGSSDRAVLIWDCLDTQDFQVHLKLEKNCDRKDFALTQDTWSSDEDQ